MTAYDLKEDFFDIYDEHPLSREDAEDAFDAWKASIPDDKAYDPFRGLAKAVENHREFIFNYRDCPSRISNGYTECANRLINETNMMATPSRRCARVRAIAVCPVTEVWPYACHLGCRNRSGCGYPKCRYDAAYRTRLSAAREGLCLTADELAAMVAIAVPLFRRGQSYETIWATHADELLCACAVPAPIRRGTGAPYLLLPRKDRMRKRKRRDVEGAGRDGVDRTGRTYAEFEALSLADRSRVVQCDSVEGYERNTYDILSAHIVARAFQIYLRKRHASSGSHRCLPRPYRESHRLCCCLRGYLRHPASRLRSRVR